MKKFSVIIPTFNRADFIESCINSVLNQDEQDFEIIVVDDASTDDTMLNLQKFNDPRIRIIGLKNKLGRSFARNMAISTARSEYIAILDSDDTMYKNRLALQGNFLDSHPQFIMVGGLLHGHHHKSKIPSDCSDFDARPMFIKENIYDHSSVTIRSQILKKLNGPYRLKHYEDYFLYSDLVRFGKFGYLPNAVGEYRYHSAQVSSTLPGQAYKEIKSIRIRFLFKCLIYGVESSKYEVYSMKIKDIALLLMPTFVYQLIMHTLKK